MALPDNLPLTTAMFNALTAEANRISLQPMDLIAENEDLQHELGDNPHIYSELNEHAHATRDAFKAALSFALYNLPSEEPPQLGSEEFPIVSQLPETLGALKINLLKSVGFAKTSLDGTEGLSFESQNFALKIYAHLQNHLYEMAQNIQQKPRVREV